jgi:hypothetical protein
MELDDARSQAIALKEKGNDAFKKHDYPTSVDFYSKAIERYDQEPSFFTNRAQVCRPTGPTWSRALQLAYIGGAGPHSTRSIWFRNRRRDKGDWPRPE